MHLLGSELLRVEPARSSRCIATLLHRPTQRYELLICIIYASHDTGVGVGGNAASY